MGHKTAVAVGLALGFAFAAAVEALEMHLINKINRLTMLHEVEAVLHNFGEAAARGEDVVGWCAEHRRITNAQEEDH